MLKEKQKKRTKRRRETETNRETNRGNIFGKCVVCFLLFMLCTQLFEPRPYLLSTYLVNRFREERPLFAHTIGQLGIGTFEHGGGKKRIDGRDNESGGGGGLVTARADTPFIDHSSQAHRQGRCMLCADC
jgi:hypothetical protein